MNKFSFLFLWIALLSAFAVVEAEVEPQNPYFQTVPTNNYTVNFSIPGTNPFKEGLPVMDYILPSNPQEAYQIQLNHVVQGVWNSNSTNGLKQISITSPTYFPTGWNISKSQEITNTTSIKVPMNCTASGSNMKDLIDGLRFDTNIPLLDEHTWPLSYPVFKFNIEVQNYRANSNVTDPLLIFSFIVNKLHLNNETGIWDIVPFTEPLKMNSKRTVNFDQAYFSINTSAVVSPDENSEGHNVEVQVMLASDAYGTSPSQEILIIYNNFDGYLNHDPEVGFGSGPGYRTFLIVSIVLLVTVVLSVVIFFIGALLVFLTRKRRREL